MDSTTERSYTDEELDREWQPTSRRPLSITMDQHHQDTQSQKQHRRLTLNSDDRTIARSFSDELMDIFRIDNSVADLDREVDSRRAKVNRNTMELASLEARLREMEERLKQNQRMRPDLEVKTSDMSKQAPTHPPPPPPSKDDKARSRPGSARAPQQAPSAGNMPPTPGGSEVQRPFLPTCIYTANVLLFFWWPYNLFVYLILPMDRLVYWSPTSLLPTRSLASYGQSP
ncbi:hypothetical protein A9K55_002033 [Cordyceps militaris]|uniref:Uncharacterized protein n=1 Tax=Cordyceps militaris TaxID=73501 RepID=A0A2H4SSQ0_CORMI|nr:hypothetical protein A9K55_002033 [Cordyceps militaris]